MKTNPQMFDEYITSGSGGGEISVTFGLRWSETTTEFEHEFKTPLLRFACFYLLSTMPDEGIAELYETLSEMREFYNARIQEDKPLLLSQPQKVQATIGKSIVRPEFSIESEM